jgi:hypothetical protein
MAALAIIDSVAKIWLAIALVLGVVLSVLQVRVVRYLYSHHRDVWERFAGRLPLSRDMWERYSTRFPVGSWSLVQYFTSGEYLSLADPTLTALGRPFRIITIVYLLFWLAGLAAFVVYEISKS